MSAAMPIAHPGHAVGGRIFSHVRWIPEIDHHFFAVISFSLCLHPFITAGFLLFFP